MNRLIASLMLVTTLCFGASSAFAQAGAGGFSGSTATGVPSIGDPCLSFTHLSAPLALASATTSVVISNHATGTNNNIYICSGNVDIIASATAKLINGTGTLCATAPATGVASTTGIMTGAAVVSLGDSQSSKLIVPAGNDVCVVGTGGGADVGGYITYVLAPR